MGTVEKWLTPEDKREETVTEKRNHSPLQNESKAIQRINSSKYTSKVYRIWVFTAVECLSVKAIIHYVT